MLLWTRISALLLCGRHIAEAAKVISLSMHRIDPPTRSLPSTPTIPLGLDGKTKAYYRINITIGTPPQPITLDIDTGSSDIWVLATDLFEDSDNVSGGCYDPDSSDTSESVEQNTFWITYADKRSVSGDYWADVVGFNGIAVENVTFAVALDLTDWFGEKVGILGLGLEANEATFARNGSDPFPGLLRRMVQQDLIHTRMYSISLSDRDTATGSLLIGGVDTDKFVGNLTVLEMQPLPRSHGIVRHFAAPWTYLGLSDSHGSLQITKINFNTPAILDTGTTFTYLPEDIFRVVVYLLEVIFPFHNEEVGLIGCDVGNRTLDFGFGGSDAAIVSVPLAELAIPLFDDATGEPYLLGDGTKICGFGLRSSPKGDPIILGDNFLRSAYVAFDLDNRLIGLAQSSWNSTASNVTELQNGLKSLLKTHH